MNRRDIIKALTVGPVLSIVSAPSLVASIPVTKIAPAPNFKDPELKELFADKDATNYTRYHSLVKYLERKLNSIDKDIQSLLPRNYTDFQNFEEKKKFVLEKLENYFNKHEKQVIEDWNFRFDVKRHESKEEKGYIVVDAYFEFKGHEDHPKYIKRYYLSENPKKYLYYSGKFQHYI